MEGQALLLFIVTITYNVGCKLSMANMLKMQVDSIPIVEGKDVGISCKTIKLCNTTRKWTRIGDDGQPGPLLMIDGAPSNNSKYGEVLQSDRFTLIIKTFSEEDICGKYQCVCGVETGVDNIPLEQFVVLPTAETVNYTLIMTQDTLKLSITFSTVRPIPGCSSVLGDRKLIAKLDKEEVDLHYKVRYTFNEIISANERCTTLSVTCKLPNYERLWKGINNKHRFTHCKENGDKRLSASLYVLFSILFMIHIVFE